VLRHVQSTKRTGTPGRTDLNLFDLDADPPASLRPGVPVRFVDCT